MVTAAFVSLTPVLARPQLRVARTSARTPQMSLRRAGARLAALPATLAVTVRRSFSFLFIHVF